MRNQPRAVEYETPASTANSNSEPAKSEAESQKNQDDATSDLQRALGGKDEAKDDAGKSAEDKAAAEIEKALKGETRK